MFDRWTRESLRRADVASASRARWLGLRRPPKEEDAWTYIQLTVEKFSTSALLCGEGVRRIMKMNQR